MAGVCCCRLTWIHERLNSFHPSLRFTVDTFDTELFCSDYVGSMLTSDCRDTLDVESRIKAASNAFGALRNCLFTSISILFMAKKSVYELILAILLLYGSEHWCLTKLIFRKLRVFHARCESQTLNY